MGLEIMNYIIGIALAIMIYTYCVVIKESKMK